jgi:hypothetical protein
MDRLVRSIGLLDKIRDRRLSDSPVLRARRSAHGFDGTSDIVRHENTLGYQVATTHRLSDAYGNVLHWHCKDIRMGDVLIRYVE